jgi:hypothetical protein
MKKHSETIEYYKLSDLEFGDEAWHEALCNEIGRNVTWGDCDSITFLPLTDLRWVLEEIVGVENSYEGSCPSGALGFLEDLRKMSDEELNKTYLELDG